MIQTYFLQYDDDDETTIYKIDDYNYLNIILKTTTDFTYLLEVVYFNNKIQYFKYDIIDNNWSGLNLTPAIFLDNKDVIDNLFYKWDETRDSIRTGCLLLEYKNYKKHLINFIVNNIYIISQEKTTIKNQITYLNTIKYPAQRIYTRVLKRLFKKHYKDKKASVIQKAWKICISDPNYLICKNRLLNEFNLLNEYEAL